MKTVLYAYVFVALGGAIGAMARYSLNLLLQRQFFFPWGTLTANLLGCFLMGVVAYLVANSQWFNETGIIPDQYRLLFAVGFLGSFTTLSMLVLELHTLLERGAYFPAASYVIVSVAGGYALFFLALVGMRRLGSAA